MPAHAGYVVAGMIAIFHNVPALKKRLDWGYYTAPQAGPLGDDRRACGSPHGCTAYAVIPSNTSRISASAT